MNQTQHSARLLDHASFLHRLAQHLAGPVDGEDLAQDTWAAAVAHGPRHDDNPRGWLATVATNLWRNTRRAGGRRAAREAQLPPPEPAPPISEIVAREEVRRRVVDAVVALPEPLRQVVVLRYYEGLDSPAIAARLAIAPSTVRSRMQQALERMRRKLDEEHGGDRAAWAVPLLQWRRAALAPAAGTVPAWLVLAGIAAIAALGIWTWSTSTRADAPSAAVSTAKAPPPPNRTRAATVSERTAGRRAVAESEPAVATPSTTYEWQPPRVAMHGIVFRARRDTPAGNFDVVVRSCSNGDSSFAAAPARAPTEWRGKTAADGSFTVAALPVGRYDIEATGPNDEHAWGRVHTTTAPQRFELLAVAKPARGLVRVRVVDATGHGVAGADVELALASRRAGYFGWDRRRAIRGKTDATGLFAVDNRPELDEITEGGALVRDGRGRAGLAYRRRDSATEPFSLTVELAPTGTITGRLAGLTTTTGVRVLAHPRQTLVFGPDCFAKASSVASDGRYRIDGLPAGDYKLQVVGSAGRSDKEQFWNTRPTTVDSGQTVASVPPVLDCSDGGTLVGVVRDARGRPVAAAAITARRPWMNNLGDRLLHHPERHASRWFAHVRTTTANDGSYRLSLPPGAWQLVAIAPGYAMDVRFDVRAEAARQITLEHTLVADGALAGHFAETVVLRPREHPELLHTMLAPGGFHVRGLTPGTWQVGRKGESGFEQLAEVEIVAGKTAWIDVSGGETRVHRGTLLCDGEPLADHEVAIGDRGVPVRTRADGSFELSHVHDPNADPAELHVRYRGLVIASTTQLDGAIQLPGRMLTVRTLSPQGRPEPAEVAIGDVYDYADGFNKYETYHGPGSVTVDSGELRFLLASCDEHTAVVATFPDGSRTLAKVGDRRELDLVRPPTGIVNVRVLDKHGLPCVGYTLRVLGWGHRRPAPNDAATFTNECADAGEQVTSTSDAKGHASLRGVPAGPALLSLWPSGQRNEDAQTRIVRVTAGQSVGVELVAH